MLAATGTNNVDLEAARERGIGVCNLRDYCTASVVQHVLGVHAAADPELREYDALVRRAPGSAATSSACSTIRSANCRAASSASSATARSARALRARRNLALGMEVLIANRPGGERSAGRLDLDELLPQVDVLSLHCPLTPADAGHDRRARSWRA